MKRFRFNLQRVLDHRQMIEDALLAELAAMQTEQERQMARLAEMRRDRDIFKVKMKEQLSGGSADDIKQAYVYLQQLTAQALAQEVVVRRMRDAINRKTDEVLEATKERKVLERLKEYKKTEHRREAERQEQKFLDDIACVRFGRAKNTRDCATGG
jgi:flagellar FliJ protein